MTRFPRPSEHRKGLSREAMTREAYARAMEGRTRPLDNPIKRRREVTDADMVGRPDIHIETLRRTR